jgi:hypothetical protein
LADAAPENRTLRELALASVVDQAAIDGFAGIGDRSGEP